MNLTTVTECVSGSMYLFRRAKISVEGRVVYGMLRLSVLLMRSYGSWRLAGIVFRSVSLPSTRLSAI
ncbi:hypothetical protein D3C85_1250020 [compost metagenome]